VPITADIRRQTESHYSTRKTKTNVAGWHQAMDTAEYPVLIDIKKLAVRLMSMESLYFGMLTYWSRRRQLMMINVRRPHTKLWPRKSEIHEEYPTRDAVFFCHIIYSICRL